MLARIAETRAGYEMDLFEITDMIASATDLSSNCIEYHEKRVAYIAKRIFEEAHAVEAPQELVLAALLHDIGIETCVVKNNLLHLFPEETDLEKHSIDGEILLNDVKLYRGVSGIIRNHHKSYDAMLGLIEKDRALLSNIINLADRIDVSIEKNKNILIQLDKIVKNVNSYHEGYFDRNIFNAFLKLSNNRSFWLDITNMPLIDRVIRQAVSVNVTIDIKELSQITDLCARIIDRKSPYTARHSANVALISERIGRLYNMDEETGLLISTAGKLHDLGKLSVPESILHKPGSLDKDEFRIIQQHTYYTYYIMDKVSMFNEIKKWAAYHHENLDGSGYPFGIIGSEIPMEARIISVADKLIALTEDRPYRVRKKKNEVVDILRDMAARNSIDREVMNTAVENYEYILDGT